MKVHYYNSTDTAAATAATATTASSTCARQSTTVPSILGNCENHTILVLQRRLP